MTFSAADLAVRMRVVRADVQLDVVERLPAQGAANGTRVLAAVVADHAVVGLAAGRPAGARSLEGKGAGQLRCAVQVHLAAEVEQVHVAGALLRHHRGAHRERLAQRQVDAGAQVHPVVGADGELGVGRDVVEARLVGHEVHRARYRVAAEQRPLRPPQHLDAFEIEQVEVGAEQEGIIDVVDVVGDRGLLRELGVGRADPAQGHRHARTVDPLRLAEGGIRNDRAEVGEVRDLALLQRLGGQRGDRDRNVLHVGRDPRAGDDDVADRATLRRLGLVGHRVRRSVLRQRRLMKRNCNERTRNQ